MKRLLLFIFFFLFLLFPRTVLAEEGWEIDLFQSNIAIDQSGKVRITETIQVNFFELEKHGIYRDIPYVYESDNGEKTYSDIQVSNVQQDGSPMEYDQSRSDGYIRLKIGDPDKTISGNHTYNITYTVTGVLRGFTDYDEL